MKIMQAILEVLRPGKPHHKALLTQLSEDQARIARALLLLDNPATREIKAATDSAAEF